MVRSSGFGSTSCNCFALFKLAFAPAPVLNTLTSLHNVTRRPVLQKVRHHPRMGLCLLVSIGFQVLFHSPPGVLFTFPSRYYSSIGHYVVFSLGRWSSRLPTGFLVSGRTPDSAKPILSFDYKAFTSFGVPFQVLRLLFNVLRRGPYPDLIKLNRFGLFPFRSPLLGKSLFYFLFLRVLRCFSSPGSPPYTMCLYMDTIIWCVPTFGYLRIKAYLRLPVAFRSLSRPSSAHSAKASSLRSSSLNRLVYCFLLRTIIFGKSYFGSISSAKYLYVNFSYYSYKYFRLFLSEKIYMQLSRCNVFDKKSNGRPKWARTTDLALIRRVL